MGCKSNHFQTEGPPQAAAVSNRAKKLIVYVASPLGFAESTRSFMSDRLIPTITNANVVALNPWDTDSDVGTKIDAVKATTDLRKRKEKWVSVVELLGANNAHAIERADGVVAVLDGVDVDSGTAAEIGYAASLGKWVIGYRGDFRRTGEDETSEVNLQVEYFIRKNGGVIVHSLQDVERELKIKTIRGKE
jgi:nucleoside 2-deoxyribosyltransferase